MTHVYTGQQGAKRQSWARDNPRSILKHLVEIHTALDKDEMAKRFWKEIKDRPEILRIIAIEYWFANNYDALMTPTVSKVSLKEEVDKLAEVMLSNLRLPTGKRLRESTGRECAQAGGFFTKIASKLKPDQIVGDVFDEAALRKLIK